MCNSSKPNYPDAPHYPSPPAAPDMGPTFELAIKNQGAQNEIASRQAGIAEGQMEIAEDRYGLSKEYRPVQEKALADAVRGQDPALEEGRARNSIMQRVTPLHEGLSSAAQTKRGMKADSPNVLADHEKLASGLAGSQAEAQVSSRLQTSLKNVAGKVDAVSAGKGIPGQAVRGMASASGAMADASKTINQANGTYMQALTSGAQANYQTAVAQWQYETGVMNMNFNYQVAMAEAEAQANQSMWSSGLGLLGMVAGGAIGFAIGGPAGGMFGAGLGGGTGGFASGL